MHARFNPWLSARELISSLLGVHSRPADGRDYSGLNCLWALLVLAPNTSTPLIASTQQTKAETMLAREKPKPSVWSCVAPTTNKHNRLRAHLNPWLYASELMSSQLGIRSYKAEGFACNEFECVWALLVPLNAEDLVAITPLNNSKRCRSAFRRYSRHIQSLPIITSYTCSLFGRVCRRGDCAIATSQNILKA